MKTLVILGSPRGKKSSSYNVAQHFITGLKNAGCQTDEILVRDLTINPCRGCYTCWLKTPGRCIHRDDMDSILAKIDEVDLVVYAFPLYIYSTPGIVKNLLDRQIPLIKPDLVEKNGITMHPRRNPKAKNRVFLISVAGFPERSHFDGLITTFKKTFRSEDNKFIGSIVIGGAEAMHREDMQGAFTDLYQLVETAGYEVAKKGKMNEKTEQALIDYTTYSKEYLTEFRKTANSYWKSFKPLANKEVIVDKSAKELKLNDGGIKSFLAGMALQYRPAALPNFEGSLQFNFDNTPYFLTINDNKCRAFKGRISKPTTTLTTTEQIWMDIGAGKINGQQAVLEGNMKVDGELGLLMKMGEMFGSDDSRQNQGENPAAADTTEKNPTDHIPDHRGPLKLKGTHWLTVMFIPWITKWIWSGFTTSSAPFLAAAGLSLFIFLYHLFTNRPTLFEIGSMIYLALSAALTVAGIQIFAAHTYFFDHLFLSALWLGSLISPCSLTAEYSCHGLPKLIWNNRVFLETNSIISGVWGLYFMLLVVFSFLLSNGIGTQLHWRVIGYILMAPMFIFTGVFQNWYPKKLMTQNVSS